MARCRPLTPDEQNEWNSIQELPTSDREEAELNFVTRVMSNPDTTTFPRENITDIPEEMSGVSQAEAEARAQETLSRQNSWEEEQEGLANVMQNQEDIADVMWTPPNVKKLQATAEAKWDAMSDEDRDTFVAENKLDTDMLVKDWIDLSPEEKQFLTLNEIPSDSLNMGLRILGFPVYGFLDMEYYFQLMQEKTGMPFLSILRRIENAAAIAETQKELILKRIHENPRFKKLRIDDVALKRVALEIESRREGSTQESPEGLTDNEIELADAIENIYKEYQPKVRYLRVIRTKPDMDSMRAEFPDAVAEGKEGELAFALQLVQMGQLEDLKTYLATRTWGVYQTGFDPWMISNNSLKAKQRSSHNSVRGRARLMQRESVVYPAEKLQRNVLQRLASYIEQMELQWNLEPEVDTLDKMWDKTYDKFSDAGAIAKNMDKWQDRVQGIPYNFGEESQFLRQVWVQSMRSIFFEKALAMRNTLQALLLHPDRAWLLKSMVSKGIVSPEVRAKGRIYFDTFVSQLGGLRKDWLHTGEEGLKILNWLNKFTSRLNFSSMGDYEWSDYVPRLWSFQASLAKASQATEKYLQNHNIQEWIKNSGVNHLRLSERNYVISHFLAQADTRFNLGVRGLQNMNGAEMANMYIAQRVTDMVNFKYRRSTRGLVEMGVTGQTIWNLVTYPRGYAQRYAFQAEKVKNVFQGNTSWEDARGGFNDIMKIMVVSQLLGAMWRGITGKKRNPFDALDVLTSWQLGGLFVGSMEDLFALGNDLATVFNPSSPREDKDAALDRIPALVQRSADTLVPFYKRALDIIEARMGRKNVDQYWVRKLIAQFNKDYTPEKLDEIDRNLWEQIKKATLGFEVPDPTEFEKVQEELSTSESQLGKLEDDGTLHTLADFGSDVNTQTAKLPSPLVSEADGFSDLTMFYVDCADAWKPYYELLTDNQREAWRKTHVEEEAMLLFWGKYTKTVFSKNSIQGKEVKRLLDLWVAQYGITKAMRPKADWSDLVPVYPTY